MNIGILGSGDVGRVLGRGFADLGYVVKIGSRNPAQGKIQKWISDTGSNASSGTFREAADFGDILVLATLWTGTENAINLAGPEHFNNKVLLDATNPLDFSAGVPRLILGHSDSGGEQVQRWLPEAHVVKAFNIVGNPHMVKPNFPGGPPDMFICGNHERAKGKAAEILKDFGWEVIDIGGIEGSRYLEPLAMIWILHYFNTKSGNHAFKMLRK